jgi:hypothetical protein
MKGVAGPSGHLFFSLEDPGELHHGHICPLNYNLWHHSCNNSHLSYGPCSWVSCLLKWRSTSRCCMNGSNACCLHFGHSFIHLCLTSFHIGNHALPLFICIFCIARTSSGGVFASSLLATSFVFRATSVGFFPLILLSLLFHRKGLEFIVLVVTKSYASLSFPGFLQSPPRPACAFMLVDETFASNEILPFVAAFAATGHNGAKNVNAFSKFTRLLASF